MKPGNIITRVGLATAGFVAAPCRVGRLSQPLRGVHAHALQLDVDESHCLPRRGGPAAIGED